MRQSQNLKLLNHLNSGGNVTSLFAFAKFNITSLHRRLSDIKKQGVAIESSWDGNGITRYKVYKLASKPKRK